MRKAKAFFEGASIVAIALLVFWTSGVANTFVLVPGDVQGAPAQNRASANTTAGGPHENVKIHGHWTIEVRNPDGKLVTHREFENGLQPSGKTELANFLGRKNLVGRWDIEIIGFANNPHGILCPAPTNVNIAVMCVIGENDETMTSAVSKNLTVNFSAATGVLTLSGSIASANAGQIDLVLTRVGQCAPLTFCEAGTPGLGPFTGTTLTSPINVAPGQFVTVTVQLTFS